MVPTSDMVGQLHSLGWLNDFSAANIPNLKNMRPDLFQRQRGPSPKVRRPLHVRPGWALPCQPGAVAGRDIKTMDDVWDPAFKGRVSLFSDAQDALGMIMLSQGNSLERPSPDTVRKAVDLVKEQKGKGQVRMFTGNDYYTNDLRW